MASIYDIKPAFQNVLRPIVKRLYAKGVTANQVTLATCLFSMVIGVLITAFHTHTTVFWLLPLCFFIRMALNAIDGMLAKEHDMKTPLGAFLNELTDIISDAALYLPFVFVGSSINSILVLFIIFASALSEATGLAAIQIGANRRYDGPMGKSDRAFAFSVVAILIALGLQLTLWLTLIWCVILGLLLYTIVRRVQNALREAQQ